MAIVEVDGRESERNEVASVADEKMLNLQLLSAPERLASVAPQWSALLAQSGTHAPFQWPLWQETWWQVFGSSQRRRLRLLLLRDGERLVGLAPFTARRTWPWPGVPCRRLELLGSGEQEAHEICSEYLGIIAAAGWEQRVVGGLVEALSADLLGPWDELALPAMSGESALPALLASALAGLGSVELTVAGGAPYVELPASWDEYLGGLSASRRYWVRRTLRDFDRFSGGRHVVERVEHPGQIERGQRILIDLHQQRWRGAGRPGAFSSPIFSEFHRRVMPRLLERGALDLSWLIVGERPVAALYNVVADGVVYFYQGGRRLDLPRGVRPGLALQLMTIQRAIAHGQRQYDFLGGTSRYKLRLATAVRPLRQLRVTRASWGGVVQRLAGEGIRAARALRSRRRARGTRSEWDVRTTTS